MKNIFNIQFFVAFIIIISFAIIAGNLKDNNTNYSDTSYFLPGTQSILGRYQNHNFHCYDSSNAKDCIEGALLRKPDQKILWLGNSQIHAINEYKIGDRTSPQILFDKLRSLNKDLIVFSQPNANLQEQDILLKYLNSKLNIKVLILPVFFDDLREGDVRENISSLVNDQANKIEDNLTIFDYTESKIDGWLKENSIIWRSREEWRGKIFLFLYELRNTVFGITPTSKRKIIKGNYINNINSLNEILKYSEKNKIEVYIYIPPIRNDVEIPYEINEYNKFKNYIEGLKAEKNFKFYNFEDAVTNENWGKKNATAIGKKSGEIDFMHFTSIGHEQLSSKLYEMLLSK